MITLDAEVYMRVRVQVRERVGVDRMSNQFRLSLSVRAALALVPTITVAQNLFVSYAFVNLKLGAINKNTKHELSTSSQYFVVFHACYCPSTSTSILCG